MEINARNISYEKGSLHFSTNSFGPSNKMEKYLHGVEPDYTACNPKHCAANYEQFVLHSARSVQHLCTLHSIGT